MSAHLFLDTVNTLKVGLLNDSMNWIELVESDESKSSAFIHKMINDLCEKNSIDLRKLKSVIKVSGPGSYTGMRVAEGVAQIFNWEGICMYGVYLFEIPQLIGINQGRFLSNAFKGEVFQYSWNGDANKKELLNVANVDIEKIKLVEKNLYAYESQLIKSGAQDVYDIARRQELNLFKKIIERGEDRTPFYYRSLDQEFKKA